MVAPWPNYTFQIVTGRYRRADGRFVPFKEIREALDTSLDNAGKNMRSVSEALQQGSISVDEWRMKMRENIKNTQLYSASAAKGGWAQLTPSDLGRIGNSVKEQYSYLDRFAEQVRRGEIPLDGRFLNRTDLYSEAGRHTYHTFEQDEKLDRGYVDYLNMMQPADHCEECVEISALEWQPIGTLPEIGQRVCKARCKCRWLYRKEQQEERGFRT